LLAKTYSFNLTRANVTVVPERVKIVPKIFVGNTLVDGDLSYEVDLLKSPLREDIAYWNCQSYYNQLKGDESPIILDCDNDGYNQYPIPDDTSLLDCNDFNFRINPGRIEICENCVDDDCDGARDMADSNCTTRMPFSNVVSHWKFDGDGDDEKGVNMGKFYDGPNLTVDNITYGRGITCRGQAVYFNNGGYMISNETINNGMNSDEGTVAVWFYRRNYQDNWPASLHNYIFSMFNWIGGVNDRMYIYFNPSDDWMGIAMGAGVWVNNIVEVPLRQWHYVVLTYGAHVPGGRDGSYSFYLDGVKIGDYSYVDFDLAQSIHWGSWADHPANDSTADSFWTSDPNLEDEYFNGSLDEAIIFDKRLNDSEVLDLWTYY
jgi:hypothetical protein